MEVDSNSNQLPPINPSSTFFSVEFGNDAANGLKISISRCNSDTDTTIATNIGTNVNDNRPKTYSRRNAFYRWLKRHLWCINSSSSSPSSPPSSPPSSSSRYLYRPNESPSQNERVLIAKQSDNGYFDDAASARKTPPFERRISRSSGNGVATTSSPAAAGNDHETTVTRSDSSHSRVKSLTVGTSAVTAGGVAAQQEERQVTFSDTVRTHIKTKYVTADEYRQIKGIYPAPKQQQQMIRPTATAPPPPPPSPNSKRMMYRYRVIKLKNRDANNDLLERYKPYDKSPKIRLFRRNDTRCARYRKKNE